MTPERWQQIKAIFDDATDCEGAVRAALVRERCVDDEDLRAEVESLLAAGNQATKTLIGAVAEGAALALAANVTVGERYVVERELGRGGMSVVYLAHDRQLLDKRVVVKVLLNEMSADPWIQKKFQQELEALVRIDHPGVVGVLDSGLTPEGKRFLVMQYIDGITLREVIEPAGMDVTRAAGILRQVGQALAAAHEKGVWHRDLKPENIMLHHVGGGDYVQIIDFGIAGIENSQFRGGTTKVAGTLTYMAPEQYSGQPCATSDTYTLGVVAYEMLTGQPPFSAESPEHLVSEQKSRPVPPDQLRPEIPAAAARAILRAMSFRPERRPADVREFSEEIFRSLAMLTMVGGAVVRKVAPDAVEIAHVLFLDLVGYSLLRMDQQKQYIGDLQRIVQESPRYEAAEQAGEIINLPTGDGMALAFFGDPTATAQCALEIAERLRLRPHLRLRMGIHSGPVFRIADMNANANLAGGGINTAQRVMDCGDAGHILVSSSVAEVLDQLSGWRECLSDLGFCEVKHGVKLHLYNLCKGDAGNLQPPSKIVAPILPKRRSRWLWPAVAALTAMLFGGVFYRRGEPAPEASAQRLEYYVTVQKYRDGKPYQAPFRLSGERVFEADYRIRFTLSSAKPGYLYALNEGAYSTAEKPDLNMLFATPVDTHRQIHIPQAGFLQFDHHKGQEKLWLVWAPAPVGELEALKKWVNASDAGAIGDPAQSRSVLSLLARYAKNPLEAARDEARQLTILKGGNAVLAYRLLLEHD